MISENLSREEELMGGITNALERGYDIMSAQKSFVNAGYVVQEVSSAAQKVSSGQAVYRDIPKTSLVKTNATPPPSNGKKTLIWVLSIVSGLILISALVLGLFWDKFF